MHSGIVYRFPGNAIRDWNQVCRTGRRSPVDPIARRKEEKENKRKERDGGHLIAIEPARPLSGGRRGDLAVVRWPDHPTGPRPRRGRRLLVRVSGDRQTVGQAPGYGNR